MSFCAEVFQGFKEFLDYYKSPTSSKDLMKDALESMRRNTRKYARRQVKWILNKLIPAIEASNIACVDGQSRYISLFLLDASGTI